MTRIGEIDLSKVSVDELKAMYDAGECVRECYRVLKRTNDSIVSEYLKRHRVRLPGDRDQATPIVDPGTNSQYLFHRSAAEDRPQESGHFHTFVQSRSVSLDNFAARPLGSPVVGAAPEDAGLCHIVAIAMDRTGFPARLFAPNNWVTGGAWYDASDVCRHLVYFTIDHADPSYPVNVWITNMLVLFRPQIRDLLDTRDRLIAARRQQDAAGDVLEDRGLAVTADRTIDVMRQLNTVREALRARTGQRRAEGNRISESAVAANAAPAASAVPLKSPRAQAAEALQGQIQTLHDAVGAAKATARALEEQLDAARREAWQREQDHEREIADLRKKQASELARQLAESKYRLHDEYRKKLADRRAEWQANMVARLNAARKETEARVSAARTRTVDELKAEWQAESHRILADAASATKIAEARRLNEAKERWDAFRRRSLVERDRTWQIAFEHRVDEAVSAWRDDEDARFAQAKAEWIAERSYRDARRRSIGHWARRVAGASIVSVVIGAAVVLYPLAKPVAVEAWRTLVVANWTVLQGEISTTIFTPDDPLQLGGGRSDGTAPAKPNPALRQSYIRPVAANLRSAPSAAADVIGVISRGAAVTRLDRRGPWVRVRVTGAEEMTGWVHSSLLADRPVR